MPTSTPTHARVHAHTRMEHAFTQLQTCFYIHTLTHARTHAHVRAHARAHARALARAHAHAHAHTHAHSKIARTTRHASHMAIPPHSVKRHVYMAIPPHFFLSLPTAKKTCSPWRPLRILVRAGPGISATAVSSARPRHTNNVMYRCTSPEFVANDLKSPIKSMRGQGEGSGEMWGCVEKGHDHEDTSTQLDNKKYTDTTRLANERL